MINGGSLLMLAESPTHGLYDQEAVSVLVDVGREYAEAVALVEVEAYDDLADLPLRAMELFKSSDYVLFQSRLGDSLRFEQVRPNCTVSYAYNSSTLGSAFCTTSHSLMMQLDARLRGRLSTSRDWSVSTGEALRLSGSTSVINDQGDSLIQRFPTSTIPPVSCADASGEILIAPWITSTAHRSYARESFALSAPVVATLGAGRIVDFSGHPADLVRLRDHYDYVGELFDIDVYHVDSWHVGIHPKCGYNGAPGNDIALWGRTIFGNPRYLHIHTCGAYTPGEICLSVIDATIEFDGDPLWDRGRLVFYEGQENRDLIKQYGLQPQQFINSAPIGVPIRSR